MPFPAARQISCREMHDVTAFILAGGQSSRMGEEKAFLDFHGHLLIDHMIVIAKEVAEQMRIVGPKQKFSAFGQIATDIYPNRGPLGGIHAALKISRTEFNLMLAVDMPFIDPKFLKYLVKQAQHTEALVTVPRVEARFQPLCACYRKEFESVADQALAEGKNKIDALFAPERTRIVEDAEFAKLGFPAGM